MEPLLNRFGDMQEEMPMTFGSLNALLQQHNGTNLYNESDMEVDGLTLVEPMAEAPAAKKRKTGSALSSVSRFGRTVSLCSHLHSLAQPTCRYPVPQPVLDILHQTLCLLPQCVLRCYALGTVSVR